MDNKLSVKFESGLYEQTYKFRSGEGMETMEDVRKFVNPDFISKVEEMLRQMHQNRLSALTAFQPLEEDDFEEII